MIETYRARIRAALRAGNIDQAWFWTRMVIAERVMAGEIQVKLKSPSELPIKL